MKIFDKEKKGYEKTMDWIYDSRNVSGSSTNKFNIKPAEYGEKIKLALYSCFQIGETYIPFPGLFTSGAIGVVYGTPKDFKLQIIETYINNPAPMPKKPAVEPKAINQNLKTRT